MMELNTANVDPVVSGKGPTSIADTAPHALLPLPYAYAALEPHVDVRTEPVPPTPSLRSISPK
jgi:hypothetical protein